MKTMPKSSKVAATTTDAACGGVRSIDQSSRPRGLDDHGQKDNDHQVRRP